ncbi:MAG: energy-coupling factor ABC transporter ATP-binding protein [Synergistaceae bacterium]|jgi:energy-coupling factor transport system ATP-binding protein|nr:energy-coupling factor ABC transporter ATP-binding protein [Synergistaceae bacterium]
MSVVIECLSYSYNLGTPAIVTALSDVSVSVERGEWVSIVGHTGSGKSTLAQHMNALLIPQSGRVEIDGTEVKPKAKGLRDLRRKVGLVFQYPEQQFFAETAREEIAFAPHNWGLRGQDLDRRVADAASAVGLDAALLESNPFSLSGGQQRRVAIASVIAAKPDYLVLDEPTAGLDATGIRELTHLLSELKRDGLAIVQVTHDLQSALDRSDRLLVMENGVGVTVGGAEDVAAFLLRNPVRGLVIPPLVQFSAGLRARGIEIPLTGDLDTIVRKVEERSATPLKYEPANGACAASDGQGRCSS